MNMKSIGIALAIAVAANVIYAYGKSKTWPGFV